MKQFARSLIVMILGWQVRRLRNKQSFKIIAIVGSIGKTSTKFAVAQTLSQRYKVRFQEGNYNDLVTVPLVFFGVSAPSLFNPLAWLAVFIRCEAQLHKPYPYDVVVVELGTDGPGQIAAFSQYVQADIAVLTSITPEHMEYFTDLDAVAKEELSVIGYSDHVVMNTDLVTREYESFVPEAITYSIHSDSEYTVSEYSFTPSGVSFTLEKNSAELLRTTHPAISELQLYSLTAASTVSDLLGMSVDEITTGLKRVVPVSGRLQLLTGIKDSVIIDDSYNSSPEAAKAVLQTLYGLKASQKIALLGNMNELGEFSPNAHTELGKFCDPKQLDIVVTLGPDANNYLATAAEANGCKVQQFQDPYAAGEYIKSIISPGAVVLVKGSQNRVYAEEAIKPILANPSDQAKLVRQSPDWLKKKATNFSRS